MLGGLFFFPNTTRASRIVTPSAVTKGGMFSPLSSLGGSGYLRSEGMYKNINIFFYCPPRLLPAPKLVADDDFDKANDTNFSLLDKIGRVLLSELGSCKISTLNSI